MMQPDSQLPTETAAALERLDDLVHAFEQHPDPAVQEAVLALLRCVDRIHRGGLRRLAELLRVGGIEQPALADPEVKLLFDLYELGAGGDRARADAVLASVRPYLESHGGRLEVLAAAAGVVTVRLSGAHHGCKESAATLRHIIEQALRDGLPDFVRLEVVETPPSAVTFVPLSSLKLLRGNP